VDVPWNQLPKKDRDWILFTDEQPTVPVYPGFLRAEVKKAIKEKWEPGYMGTFTGARRYVLHTFATTQSALMKKRVSQYMLSSPCPTCGGKRLKKESLSVTFAGLDIADMSALPLAKLLPLFQPYAAGTAPELKTLAKAHEEQAMAAQRISEDVVARLQVLLDLGLGYLSLERSTPTLSPGELQRLRLATQVRSNLFGVVYVLDEPSAGLHPVDTEALLRALDGLKASGNSLFVVEHELDVIRHADWIVDVGPAAGEGGGEILYSGQPEGLKEIKDSQTRRWLYAEAAPPQSRERAPQGWLMLSNVSRNNLHHLEAQFPLGVLTAVTGISGSGKSSLVSGALVDLVAEHLGHEIREDVEDDPLQAEAVPITTGRITEGMAFLKRLVTVDQKPIGRTPRSNLATYTGLFDGVRKLFAATKLAKSRQYDAGRFSFNVGKGRCPNCEGEGFVMVELLFLPSVYAPCPVCGGTRYNQKTLEVEFNGKNIAEVLKLTVDEAAAFFENEASIYRSLSVLQEVGLGYLRLGQPATELSGGEAQRIKLATELQRLGKGNTLYVLDEPTTGLHPSDVQKLVLQLHRLVDAGNTVVVVEHDMSVISQSDWVMDMGPGAGEAGGKIVVAGTPAIVAASKESRTAPYLKKAMTG
jgi:excinuclease ABC subunit A